MLDITILQPNYYSGDNPDEKIAEFLLNGIKNAKENSLVVLPEYSNAGGLSDKNALLKALPRAKTMLAEASKLAKEKSCYVAINLLEERDNKFRNSTYLLDKNSLFNSAYTWCVAHIIKKVLVIFLL